MRGHGLPSKEFRVELDVAAMLCGHVVVEIDRGHRALGLTRTAVDAFVRIDEHLYAREASSALGGRNLAELIERNRSDDAVAWTDVDACGVARADALLSDDVCHDGA